MRIHNGNMEERDGLGCIWADADVATDDDTREALLQLIANDSIAHLQGAFFWHYLQARFRVAAG